MKHLMKRLSGGIMAGVLLCSACSVLPMQAAAYTELPVNSANYDTDSDVMNIIAPIITADSSEFSSSGLKLTYTIYVLPNADQRFSSCRIALYYPAAFTLTDASYNSSFSSMSPIISKESGKVTISLETEKNSTLTAVPTPLMSVVFQIPAGTAAGSYLMKLKMEQFLNAQKEPLSYYQSNGSVTITGTSQIPTVEKYTVTYSSNGGSGSIAPASVEKGSRITLPACTFAAPANMEFAGWKVNGTVCQPGSQITVSSNLTIEATWKQVQVSVQFDANGGSGFMAKMAALKGSSIVLPGCSFAPPSGKTFDCWLFNGRQYQAGANVTLYDNAVFSAVWKTSSLRGDVTGDGTISADDAQLTLQAYVNGLAGIQGTLNETQKTAADVNRDGQIYSDDAQYILQYYVKSLAGYMVSWESILHF